MNLRTPAARQVSVFIQRANEFGWSCFRGLFGECVDLGSDVSRGGASAYAPCSEYRRSWYAE